MSEIEELTPERKWALENQRAIAERAHDENWNFGQHANEAAIQSGSLTLKYLILINGGAAITMLAFVGNLATSDGNHFADRLAELTLPLMWFGWGVAVAAAGTAFSYITNLAYASAAGRRKRIYDLPYLEDTTASTRWVRTGRAFHVLALISGVLSLAVFLIGIASVRDAILIAPIP